MIVLYEHDNCYDLYKYLGVGSITKQRFFDDFVGSLDSVKKLDDYCYILLDEKHFHYFTYTISLTSRDGFSIKDFKQILSEKLNHIQRKEGVPTEYTTYTVQNCVIDGVESAHYIGKNGNICFDLSIIVLKPSISTIMKQQYGSSYATDGSITILPRSYYLIEYIKNILGKDHVSLLTIYDEVSSLVTVHRGLYHRVETVNIAEKLLRACYKEHDIQQYLYEGYELIEKNPLLRRLVEQSLEFYNFQLCGWLQNHLGSGSELLMVSNLVENPLFVSSLTMHYHKAVNGFIIPLNTLFRSFDVSYEYTPAELGVVATFLLANKHKYSV